MGKFLVHWFGLLTMMLVLCIPAYPCTYFFLQAKDGAVVSGRSMEFFSNLYDMIDAVPGGTSFETTAPEGTKPVRWKAKYGFVAISHFGLRAYSEGLNEKGLAAGALWFADAQYPKVEPGDEVVDALDLVGWILSNFETVEEVKAALDKVKIIARENKLFNIVPPLHHYVTDAGGNSVVLECIDGRLKIWDNRRNGVMTNEPNLGWHLVNLRFYSNLKPHYVPVPALKDDKWWLGSGMLGLPGDYSTASRFVRTSVLKFFVEKPKDCDGAVNLAVHLLNVVDIPYGPQLWIVGEEGNVQWTSWIVVYDQTNRLFYYRTYENQNLRRIDLKEIDLKPGTAYRSKDLFGGQGYLDDTQRFK